MAVSAVEQMCAGAPSWSEVPSLWSKLFPWVCGPYLSFFAYVPLAVLPERDLPCGCFCTWLRSLVRAVLAGRCETAKGGRGRDRASRCAVSR